MGLASCAGHRARAGDHRWRAGRARADRGLQRVASQGPGLAFRAKRLSRIRDNVLCAASGYVLSAARRSLFPAQPKIMGRSTAHNRHVRHATPDRSDSRYASQATAVKPSWRSARMSRNAADYRVTLAKATSSGRRAPVGLRRDLRRARLRAPRGGGRLYAAFRYAGAENAWSGPPQRITGSST